MTQKEFEDRTGLKPTPEEFNNIPDVEMRAKLKSEAFKWSPKNQAWQRQLTPNAVRAAKRVLGVEKFGA